MRYLQWTNAAGVSVNLDVNPYLITSLEGVDGPPGTTQTQKAPFQDGETFLDDLLDIRDVAIQGAIAQCDQYTYWLRRQTLVQAFNRKLGPGTLTLIKDPLYPSDDMACSKLPLTDMPAYPNSSGGTVFQQSSFSALPSGWSTYESPTLSFANGVMTITAGAGGASGIVFNSIPYPGYLIVKCQVISGQWNVCCNGNGTWNNLTPGPVQTVIATPTQAGVQAIISGDSAGSVIQVLSIYIGTGAYSTTVQDSVRNLPMTINPGAFLSSFQGPGGTPMVDTTYGYLSGSDAGLPAGNSPRTILIPFRTTINPSTSNGVLLGYGTPSANQGLYLANGPGALVVSDWVSQVSTPNTPYLDGNVHLLGLAYDGTTMFLSVDSTIKASAPMTVATVLSGDLSIGTWGSLSANLFQGQVGVPLILPVCLNQAQISRYIALGGVQPPYLAKRKITGLPVGPIFPNKQGPDPFQTFKLDIDCLDPYWYAVMPSYISMKFVGAGMKYPMTYPLVFSTVSSTPVTATSLGDVPAPVTITITGPSINPKVTNSTTGQYIQILKTLAAGETLTIVTTTGQKSVIYTNVAGVQTTAMQYLALGSTFWSLVAGANLIGFSDSGGSSVQTCSLTWYDRFLGV